MSEQLSDDYARLEQQPDLTVLEDLFDNAGNLTDAGEAEAKRRINASSFSDYLSWRHDSWWRVTDTRRARQRSKDKT